MDVFKGGGVLLVELELETLDESLPGDGVSVLEVSLCPSPSTPISLSDRTPGPSSQPFRLLKVILAFRMWYRGISVGWGWGEAEQHICQPSES